MLSRFSYLLSEKYAHTHHSNVVFIECMFMHYYYCVYENTTSTAVVKWQL